MKRCKAISTSTLDRCRCKIVLSNGLCNRHQHIDYINDIDHRITVNDDGILPWNNPQASSDPACQDDDVVSLNLNRGDNDAS